MQPIQVQGRQNHTTQLFPVGKYVRIQFVIMPESRIQLAVNIARAAGVVCLVVFSCALAAAQASQQVNPVTSINQADKDKDKYEGTTPASIEEEMRAKRAIKVEEREYQKNVDRARDLSALGEAVKSSFKQKNYLGREEIQKLEKAEKLAKAIRSAAGGSEDDNEMEQPPKDLGCAVEKFAEVATSLKKNVEKTPKHVVSAAVIDEANVLLELTRIVRALNPAQ